jgi:uncharacterized protein
MINRSPTKTIIKRLKAKDHKIAVIYGSRQIGKTTLSNEIIRKLNYKTLSINADETEYREILSSQSLKTLKSLVTGYELLFIDEAQRIPDIGINLKIMHDQIPELRIIVTGSSSLDLANSITEPLTGRKWTYRLFPISYIELSSKNTPFELTAQLENRLIYGAYPQIICMENTEEKKMYLKEIINNYLYKDILDITGIKKPYLIKDLLILLAYQIGSEVSLHELGTQLGISKDTVWHYLYLLQESFVIFNLRGFSRNLRKEVTRKSKFFFWDLGIRNALIDNYQVLKRRVDKGQLWENFVIAERLKNLEYTNKHCSSYFWRTYTGAELDYVEEGGGEVTGYEIKWKDKKPKIPQTWKQTYNGKYEFISTNNYLNFITA